MSKRKIAKIEIHAGEVYIWWYGGGLVVWKMSKFIDYINQ